MFKSADDFNSNSEFYKLAGLHHYDCNRCMKESQEGIDVLLVSHPIDFAEDGVLLSTQKTPA